MEVNVEEAFEEERVAYSIEGLRQVGCCHDSSEWRFSLIEAVRDFGGEGEEGGNRGTGGAKAVLKRGLRKRREEERTDKTLEDFRGGAKKRYGAIGGAQVKGFTWFRDREDEGLFPDRGEVRVREGEVKEKSEKRDCFRA